MESSVNSFTQKPTILVVDDDSIFRDIANHALAQDYRIIEASDGESAFGRAVCDLPDLILLDVVMPGVDGFEAARRLKHNELTAHIPIVFLTGSDNREFEATGLGLGAVDFIVKPFSIPLMKARVQNHLTLKKYQDHLQEELSERSGRLALTQEAVIASMAILAEYRDNETGAHIQRTRHYVKILFEGLCRHFPEEVECVGLTLFGGRMLSGVHHERWVELPGSVEPEVLYQSAALHDIGKVAIRDGVLLKPSELTVDEFEEMKRHTIFGMEVIRRTESILGTNSFLRLAREIVEFHHEKWDGSGYPHGIKGNEIPVSARIMALADVYDALTSKRCYKEPISHEAAVKVILNGDGRTRPEHFCPKVLEVFSLEHLKFKSIAAEYRESVVEFHFVPLCTAAHSAPINGNR